MQTLAELSLKKTWQAHKHETCFEEMIEYLFEILPPFSKNTLIDLHITHVFLELRRIPEPYRARLSRDKPSLFLPKACLYVGIGYFNFKVPIV